ncbi:hypothetical protein [Marinobacter sp. OP 3.4]|uniref:hypothetical protein n=1 Tax=Marinobacter sp. OP 3.4 TaxID=3076501 RepID=UPI002E204099
MKSGLIRAVMACALTLAAQGCATSEDEETAKAEAASKDADKAIACNVVFHCPADPTDVKICRDQDQLRVLWQTPGIDAYRLTGTLGQTFKVDYSQRHQVIENTLAWQHMGIRYRAFHYLDESRPETLEEIGITLETRGESRTISCNGNAVSRIAWLHHPAPVEEETTPDTGE